MSEPVWEDIMKYDGRVPEPPYTTTSDLIDQIAELEAQLALCAAGPWRYDVENAKSGPSYWVAYKFWGMGRELVAYDVCHMSEGSWYKNDGSGLCEGVFAFATINPPQEPTP